MTDVGQDVPDSPAILTLRIDHDGPLQVASLGLLLESLAVLDDSVRGGSGSYFDDAVQRWRVPPIDETEDLSPEIIALSDNFIIEFATLVAVGKLLVDVAGVVSAVLTGLDMVNRRRESRRNAAEKAEESGTESRLVQIVQQVAGDLLIGSNVTKVTVTIEAS